MADVEVGLGAVVGDEHLAVLERVHRAGVDVEVGVELLHRHPQPAGLQQAAEGRGGEALAQRGGDASGDEDVLGRVRALRCGQVNSRGRCRMRAAVEAVVVRADGSINRPRGSSLPTPGLHARKPRLEPGGPAPGLVTGRPRLVPVGVSPVRGARHRAVGGVDGAVLTGPACRLAGQRHHVTTRPAVRPSASTVDTSRAAATSSRTAADRSARPRRGGRAGEHHAVGAPRRRRLTSVVTIVVAPCRCSASPRAGAGDEQHQAAAPVQLAVDRHQPGGRSARPGCWSPRRRRRRRRSASVPTARASRAPDALVAGWRRPGRSPPGARASSWPPSSSTSCLSAASRSFVPICTVPPTVPPADADQLLPAPFTSARGAVGQHATT